jgi:hypothetical protein
VDDGVLDALASCFDDICSLVDGFVKQGEPGMTTGLATLVPANLTPTVEPMVMGCCCNMG